MIIKNIEFDKQLYYDLQWININKNKPLKIKGSYIVKKYGDILSDIDIQANIYFTPSLLKVLYNIIKKNSCDRSPFTFIHLIVGKYKEFNLPWKIDNDCEYYYNIEKTKQWFLSLQRQQLVPILLLKFIYIKLFSTKIKISNLIDVEKALYIYSGILWEKQDILNGYKYVRGIRYILLEEMKYETPVIEYLYSYKDTYINIDFALVDRMFISTPTDKSYAYYTNDFYKIMKTFRWKLKPQYKQEYLNTMKKVEVFIAIKYKINTIQTILSHHSKRYGKDKIIMELKFNKLLNNLHIDLHNVNFLLENKPHFLNEINDKIQEYVNDKLKNNIIYYVDKLSNKDDIKKLNNFLIIGVKSQQPISQKKLEDCSNILYMVF